MWNAPPSTSNGNEQAHRNINRDGIQHTLLAAIMRGLQLDTRAIASFTLYRDQGIFQCDTQPTYAKQQDLSVLHNSK